MKFDVIIIGAGATGLLAMRYLAKAGYHVCMLEAAEIAGGRISTIKGDFENYAEAGADIIAPSSMTDGLVWSIRKKLDYNAFRDTKIMSFSKQLSDLYTPFRLTTFKKFSKMDKAAYQIGYSNSREILKKIELDLLEGADIITIKPSLGNLDLVNRVFSTFKCKIAVHHVSGEYTMLKAASRIGLLDEYEWVLGYFACMIRAGADLIISYSAEEVAALL